MKRTKLTKAQRSYLKRKLTNVESNIRDLEQKLEGAHKKLTQLQENLAREQEIREMLQHLLDEDGGVSVNRETNHR